MAIRQGINGGAVTVLKSLCGTIFGRGDTFSAVSNPALPAEASHSQAFGPRLENSAVHMDQAPGCLC